MIDLKRIFYHVKYRDQEMITRILFFKFKKKIPINHKSQLIKLWHPSVGEVGRCTYGTDDLEVASPKTTIGNFCSIGRRCVLGHGDHPVNFLSTSPYFYLDKIGYKSLENRSHNEYMTLPPIHIGNDVWIGDGVFVKNGVTIHDGAIVGARSLVTKDVPPYAIVVGSPAKIMKYRFDASIIDELLLLKWWDLPDEVIKQIPYDDIHQAIDFLQKKDKSSSQYQEN